jgi:hypothetical protein
MVPQKRNFDSYARQDLSYKHLSDMNENAHSSKRRVNKSFKAVATQRFTPQQSMMTTAPRVNPSMSPRCEILSNTDSHESSGLSRSTDYAMIYEMAKKITQSYEKKNLNIGMQSKGPSSSYQTCTSMPQTCYSPSKKDVRSSKVKKFQKFPEIMSLLKQSTASNTPINKTKK